MEVALHPFDLHVLGMPPAFVLSQDQTLRLTAGPSKPGNQQSPYPLVISAWHPEEPAPAGPPKNTTPQRVSQDTPTNKHETPSRAAARASLPV